MRKVKEDVLNCNHHHELTDKQKIIDLGTGKFVADMERIPLLKALNECGLVTRTHCYGHETGRSFVGIITDNVDIQVRKIEEPHVNRDTFKGKTELLIWWDRTD